MFKVLAGKVATLDYLCRDVKVLIGKVATFDYLSSYV